MDPSQEPRTNRERNRQARRRKKILATIITRTSMSLFGPHDPYYDPAAKLCRAVAETSTQRGLSSAAAREVETERRINTSLTLYEQTPSIGKR